MSAVFLGGSRRIARLNPAIRRRLEELVSRQMQILIGDASGADRAMQQQLAEWSYSNVVVFFVGSAPRHNEGAWPTRRIPTASSAKGFDFYATKDRAMANEAECGLMLWDGESRGTLANVEHLVRDGKPVALYVSSAHRFIAVRSPAELSDARATLGFKPIPASDASSQTALDLGAAPGTPKRLKAAR